MTPSDSPERTPLGRRLFEARSALERRLGRRVPQTEVGEAVGVHGVTVGGWEVGKSEPSLAMLEQLAVFYGVDVAWLGFGIITAPRKEVPPGTPGALPVHELRTERPAIPASEALAREQKRGKDGGKKRA